MPSTIQGGEVDKDECPVNIRPTERPHTEVRAGVSSEAGKRGIETAGNGKDT